MQITRRELLVIYPDNDEQDDFFGYDVPTVSAQQLRDQDLAAWCLITRQDDLAYRRLTRSQRTAFLRLATTKK